MNIPGPESDVSICVKVLYCLFFKIKSLVKLFFKNVEKLYLRLIVFKFVYIEMTFYVDSWTLKQINKQIKLISKNISYFII